MEKYLSVLKATALFEGLEAEEIEALCRALQCRSAHYLKGSVIVRRGERVERAGIVLSGAVRAERNGVDGALHVIAQHGVGGLFGDVLTVSHSGESPVDIVAAEESEVLFVPLAEIMGDGAAECGTAQIRLRRNLLYALAEKYWALNRQVDILRAPTLRARLARRLLDERRTSGSDAFTLPGTRETLAAELGVNRSALCRELGAMRREKLLTAKRGVFVLLDVPALRRIAER